MAKLQKFSFITPITNNINGTFVHGGDLQISGVFNGFLNLDSGIYSDFVIHSITLNNNQTHFCDFIPVYLKNKKDLSECWIDDACDAHCQKTFTNIVEVPA